MPRATGGPRAGELILQPAACPAWQGQVARSYGTAGQGCRFSDGSWMGANIVCYCLVRGMPWVVGRVTVRSRGDHPRGSRGRWPRMALDVQTPRRLQWPRSAMKPLACQLARQASRRRSCGGGHQRAAREVGTHQVEGLLHRLGARQGTSSVRSRKARIRIRPGVQPRWWSPCGGPESPFLRRAASSTEQVDRLDVRAREAPQRLVSGHVAPSAWLPPRRG